MNATDNDSFAEDLFQDTRMSFGDHLEELRGHLWRGVIGFLLVLALVFAFDSVGLLTETHFGIGRPMMDFIIAPVESALRRIYDERLNKALADIEEAGSDAQLINQYTETPTQVDIRALAIALAKAQQLPEPQFPGFDEGPIYADVPTRIQPVVFAARLENARRLLGPRPGVTSLGLMEVMMVYFKVAVACGVVLGSPWLFWQFWSFVATGLYPHEKKWVHVYLPLSLGLFLGGVLLCEFLVIPKSVDALLWFNQWLDVEPNIRLDEWLGFAIMMPLVFGASFQVPLVMLFLERMSILTVSTYKHKRKIAYFLLALFAAVITPTADFLNMALLWIPMCLLYELGIGLCRFSARKDVEEDLSPDVPATMEV
jgi:sec-independent protein translocase protein TatC